MRSLILAVVLSIAVQAAWGAQDLPLLTQEDVNGAMGHDFWLVAWSGNGTLHDSPGVGDSSGLILRDKSRIFEPIYYKYKIPTVMVDAYRFSNLTGADALWSTSTGEPVFGLMPFRGSSPGTGDCFFASNEEGAVTSCRMDDVIVRAAIHDRYHEHYEYKENMTVSADEPTIIMANEMISRLRGEPAAIHEIIRPAAVEALRQAPAEDSAAAGRPGTEGSAPLEEERLAAASPGHTLEYSCKQDDFGVVTLDGLYINDNVYSGSVQVMVILYDGGTALLSDTEILHVGSSGPRQFQVHARWDGGFTHCEAHAWMQ